MTYQASMAPPPWAMYGNMQNMAPTRMTWGQAMYTPDGQLILPPSTGWPEGLGAPPNQETTGGSMRGEPQPIPAPTGGGGMNLPTGPIGGGGAGQPSTGPGPTTGAGGGTIYNPTSPYPTSGGGNIPSTRVGEVAGQPSTGPGPITTANAASMGGTTLSRGNPYATGMTSQLTGAGRVPEWGNFGGGQILGELDPQTRQLMELERNNPALYQQIMGAQQTAGRGGNVYAMSSEGEGGMMRMGDPNAPERSPGPVILPNEGGGFEAGGNSGGEGTPQPGAGTGTYGGASQPWGPGVTPNTSNPYAYQGVNVRWNPQINPQTGQPYGYEEVTTAQQQVQAGITGYDINGNPTFANRQWQTDISGYMPSGQATIANQQAYAQMYGTAGNFGGAGQATAGIGGTGLTLNAQQQQWTQQFQQQQADLNQALARAQQTGNYVDPVTGQSVQTLQAQAQALAAQQQQFMQQLQTTQQQQSAQQQQFTQQLQTAQQALQRAQQNGEQTGNYTDPITGQTSQTLQAQQQQFAQLLANTQQRQSEQAQQFGQQLQTTQEGRAAQQQQFTQQLQSTQQALARAQQNGQMTGRYVDPETGQSVETLQSREQQFSQQLQTQQEARAAQQQTWGQQYQQQQADIQNALARAQQSGNLTDPLTGQTVQTLQAQQQQFTQGITAAGLTGSYEGQTTLAGRQQALAEQQAAQDWQYKQAMMAANPANYAVTAALQGRAPWQSGLVAGATGQPAAQAPTTAAGSTAQTAGGGAAGGTPSTGGRQTFGNPNLGVQNARQMNLANYTSMRPDERQAFNSAVVAGGQSAENYQEEMRRRAPQQQGRTVATFS